MKTVFLASCFALVLAAAAGCSKPAAKIAAKPADVDYYTCTMHPSVRSQDPDGKCPICGMDLVPVLKAGAPAAAASDAPREFTIPLDRQQLIGVTYATAQVKPLRRSLRAAGVVAATTAKHWDYVARVDGYVHDLRVAAPGDRVTRGQVLLDLYSPDLVATENEYLDLLRMREAGRRDQNPAAAQDAGRLLAAARARLEQWNISPEQVAAVERNGKADEFLALTSPVTGLVEEVGVHQGRHVSVGDHLVDLVDLSSVWVWADFYENELPLLKAGLPVAITSAGRPGFRAAGRIGVLDPFVDPAKRTARARIDVDNPGLELLPGAYVDVTLALDEGEGLTVPVGAVLPTGQHNLVFVDKGGGRLEPRFVELGGQY
ncbi:MAG TPA: efflux RND transporter periplasmic adaptor subunit, partial [Opitutaceae bacterium]|nr:efflux RND transporter periplasmic adaptor subunit [Opitutaceae bacterium]